MLLMIFMATGSYAQVPATPAAPVPTPAASAPAPVSSPDAATAAMEPVRQAIARQDYTAARTALETIRQQDPTNPHLALYDSIIQARQAQGGAVGVRTPRAGVTPAPTPVPTATPIPTPVPTPLAAHVEPAPAAGDLQGKARELFKNDMVRYGAIAAAALILLGIIMMILKKRKAARELEEPISTSSMGSTGGLGSLEDYSGTAGSTSFDSYGTTPGGGLGTSPLSGDFTSSTPTVGAYGSSAEDSPGMGGGSAAGLGGLAGAGAMSGYTIPSFGEEEEEEPAPKVIRNRPVPVDDDAPVSLTDDEPPTPAPAPATEPDALPEARFAAPAEPGSPEGLGINFDALATPASADQVTPMPDFARPDEETRIINPPVTSNVTPSSNPSYSPGNVDLEDIFGSQALPAEDANSQTLPTFVSAPGAGNPEEDVVVPPRPAPQRPAPAAEDHTISFEELFGSPGSSPEPVFSEPAPEPEPAPAQNLSQPSSEISIEDALAATLSSMQAEAPQAEAAPEPLMEEPASSESLDERSERMFREQMDKARRAVEEKNWRQAVHFLSIASALHPENEEAKAMLKEARAEKRKAEESV